MRLILYIQGIPITTLDTEDQGDRPEDTCRRIFEALDKRSCSPGDDELLVVSLYKEDGTGLYYKYSG